MEMTTLGRTGLEVSRLGVGLVEIGVELGWADEAQAAGASGPSWLFTGTAVPGLPIRCEAKWK